MKKYLIIALSLLIFLPCFSGCSKSKEEIDALEKRVFDQVSKINLNLENPSGSVYVAFRKDGFKQEELWSYKSSWQKGLKSSVKLLLQKRIYPDYIEICIPYSSEKINLRDASNQNLNVHRGIQGLQFNLNGKIESVCPTQMIADNTSFKEVIDKYIKANRINKNIISSIKFEKFEAKQFLLSLDKNGDKKKDFIKEIHRGNTLVAQSDITKKNVEILADKMAEWLLNNLSDNGKLIYEYWPSTEKESTSNNMIRQFMGTAAIGRWAEFVGSDEIYEKQKKNLEYNLDRFYEEEGALGY
ncbi:MAG: hypothetical protein ACRENO_03610, partial [Thermodesulfobacteriota bacterium]